MLPLYTAVKLLRDLPSGVLKDSEGIIVHIFEPSIQHGLGYLLEIGPWDEHGKPTKVIEVDAGDVEKDETAN